MAQPLPLFSQDQRQVYSVRHLTRDLRRSLERGFSGIWVEGEISNFKRHSSGHCYFTLKDDEAQLRAVMFRSQARFVRLNRSEERRVGSEGRAGWAAERPESTDQAP